MKILKITTLLSIFFTLIYAEIPTTYRGLTENQSFNNESIKLAKNCAFYIL